MNQCSGCGYIVPPAWTECRRCGAALDAPVPAASRLSALASSPPPPSIAHPGAAVPAAGGFGAPDDALLPGARPRDIGPDTMLPASEPQIVRIITPPPRKKRVSDYPIAILAVIAIVAVGGAVALWPNGHAHATQQPTMLAARPPFAGIPTSLEEIVRISAESARHTALSTVISTAGQQGAPLDVTQLAAAQPDYQWVLGAQPSTTDTVVSITSEPGLDVIAVAGTNHEICAFARWSPSAGATYVTMDHEPACAATAAPVNGWSALPGGSAQDLPFENGS